MKELRFDGFESLYDMEEYVTDEVIKLIPHGEFLGTVIIQIRYEEQETMQEREDV